MKNFRSALSYFEIKVESRTEYLSVKAVVKTYKEQPRILIKRMDEILENIIIKNSLQMFVI